MYTVSKTIRITKATEGAVVLAIEAGKVLRLNPTGLLILERLQNGATESGIIDEIKSQFGIDYELAGGDVSEFLAQIQSLGLIEKSSASDLVASVPSCDGRVL